MVLRNCYCQYVINYVSEGCFSKIAHEIFLKFYMQLEGLNSVNSQYLTYQNTHFGENVSFFTLEIVHDDDKLFLRNV